MFRYFVVLLILFGIFNDVSAHNRKVASDGCHREGDSYHCHSADTTIGFISNEARYYEVDRVIDGDTLDFIYSDQGIITTRLYGVDTPEIRKGTKLTKDAKSVLEQGGTTPDQDDYEDLLETEKEPSIGTRRSGNAIRQGYPQQTRMYSCFSRILTHFRLSKRIL